MDNKDNTPVDNPVENPVDSPDDSPNEDTSDHPIDAADLKNFENSIRLDVGDECGVTSKSIEILEKRSIQTRQTETRKLVQSYVEFCRKSGLNSKQPQSLIMMIAASIKSANKARLFSAMFEGVFIDWDTVNMLQSNSFGGTSHCLEVMNYIHFDNIEVAFRRARDESAQGARMAMLRFFVEETDRIFMDLTNINRISLSDILRVLILYSLDKLDGSVAITQYTSRLLKKPTETHSLRLIASIAERRFSDDDYLQSLEWLLRQAKVNPRWESEVKQFYSTQESIEKTMQMKHHAVTVGRPRLSDRLPKDHKLHTAMGGSGSLMKGSDTFDGWCVRVRFPTTTSLSLKKRLYLVMSNPHINHEEVVPKLTSKEIAESVVKQIVAHPEENKLGNFIEELDMQMAPFPELVSFMKTCFRTFRQGNKADMNILKYTHLYIAAYQHNSIWKDCWAAIYPLLGYQIIKDVEDFVKQNKFSQDAFVKILQTV